jgi:hypothetical protein
MTTRLLIGSLAVALLLLVGSSATAHHSFTAVYDGTQVLVKEGVVRQFRLVNPHALLALDVTDETGTVHPWVVEFHGRLNLTVGGWTDSTIKVGERVTISGNPERTGASRMFFVKLVRADGTELLLPQVERYNAIEAERRQRALERTPQDGR